MRRAEVGIAVHEGGAGMSQTGGNIVFGDATHAIFAKLLSGKVKGYGPWELA